MKLGGAGKLYVIDSFSEADTGENEKNDRSLNSNPTSHFSCRNDETKDLSHDTSAASNQQQKKSRFSKDLSQSFAVEQISEHTNRIASRKLMFSQKLSGVVVTTSAEEIYEKGKSVAVNDYFFLKTLGKGAFGEVKLATKDLIEDDLEEDHQRFAIKVLKKVPQGQASPGQFKFRNSRKESEQYSDSPIPSDPATACLPEAIRREIEVMKLLAHKNLVRLIEIISDEECEFFYMVLEHVEGGPIMRYNPQTNRFVHSMTGRVMGESTARRAFKNLVSGLAHMHSHHIAHRDIKPDNLLIDFRGNLKLSDFGVSSHFSSDRHKKSISLKELKKSTSRGIATKTEGTFPFYSPEMCSETAGSYSAYMADTWAASVCLWIFVFGQLPFYHPDVTVLFQQIREVTPQLVHRVSPELEHLLSVALAKNITLRPYISEMRYHCWVTEEPLAEYLEKGIVYQADGQEIPRPGTSYGGDHELVRKASSFNENFHFESEFSSPFSIKMTKHLSQLAENARITCEARRNEFVLKQKSEVNHLVRKRLAEIEALNTNSKNKLLEAEEEDEDDEDPFGRKQDSSDSETSDPLGMMASVMDDGMNTDALFDASEGTSRDRKSVSASKQRASARTAKFSKLNVLASIEDDVHRSQSQVDLVPIKYGSRCCCCCFPFFK